MDKCIAMAPDADVGPGGDSPYYGRPSGDLRYPGVQHFFTDSRTGWVRLIAEWEYFSPSGVTAFDPSAPTFQDFQYALDRNVVAARDLGLRVILLTRGFAEYANNNTVASPDGQTSQFMFPGDLGPQSSYARWIFYLMDRYHPVNRFDSSTTPPGGIKVSSRWIDFFEFVNEPNYECWPQSEAVVATAQKFQTAYRIASYLNAHKTLTYTTYYGGGATTQTTNTKSRPLRILGPSTADTAQTGKGHTAYDEFTIALVDELQSVNFNMSSHIVGWSHHNYDDVRNRMPMKGNRAQRVRSILQGNWNGYPGTSSASPKIYLTEGGYHRPKSTLHDAHQDNVQNSDLKRAIQRLKNNRGPGQQGDGIHMFTNYLFFTEPSYDSGLCAPVTYPYQPPPSTDPTYYDSYERPAYAAWKNLF